MNADDVLTFWFSELKPEQWFKADPALDAHIERRFGSLHQQLSERVPDFWKEPPRMLAAIIVLDQFSRNIHRGKACAFANDSQALALSWDAIDKGYDRNLNVEQRQFLYMPFQHAEDPDVQARSVLLFEALGDEEVAKYARAHRDIIVRFGRFPHRNAILGRVSTLEEIAFLKLPGSSF